MAAGKINGRVTLIVAIAGVATSLLLGGMTISDRVAQGAARVTMDTQAAEIKALRGDVDTCQKTDGDVAGDIKQIRTEITNIATGQRAIRNQVDELVRMHMRGEYR